MSSTSYGSITVSNLRSITNVVNYYLATSESSGVTKSTDGWTTGIQTMTSTNQYLWNYEETILGDGTVLSSTSPIIIGRYGQNGGTGRGIAQIQEHYLATSASSGVTTSTSGWKDTVQATSVTNRYLWNYETITWTSGTPITENTDPRIIGTHGVDGRTYSIEFSNSSIKKSSSGAFTPSTITVTTYYRDGTSNRQTYAGRIHVVGNKSDGSTTVIQNASSTTNNATYSLTPNATYVSYTISLYAAGGATTLLAIETLPIVSDGVSVTSVNSSKSGDTTTVTVTLSDGTSKQFTVNDGAVGATAQWYYGDKLSHTSGAVTKTTIETATPDAVVGSMYLNPDTSLCYRCTAISGSNATWTYAGDLTTGVFTAVDNMLTQREIFNRLTNNQTNQGVYLDGTNLYINATMIQSGVFTVPDPEDPNGDPLFQAGQGAVIIKALNKLGMYFEFGDDGVIIGKNNSNMKLYITNNRLSFKQGENEVAYISSDKLHITNANIVSSLAIGNFTFEPQTNGNLSFRRVVNI